jgi:hypothetical protein
LCWLWLGTVQELSALIQWLLSSSMVSFCHNVSKTQKLNTRKF